MHVRLESKEKTFRSSPCMVDWRRSKIRISSPCMLAWSRKKTFRPGDSLDFELVVGKNSVVDQDDKILQYYGPHYPRTYEINQQACLVFAALNECGEQYFVT